MRRHHVDEVIMIFQYAIHYALNEEWKRQYYPNFLDVENTHKMEMVLEIPFDDWPFVPSMGLSFLIKALERRGNDVSELYEVWLS